MTPLYQTGNEEFTLYHGDTMELIGNIGKKVDMIFADPQHTSTALGNLLRKENGIESHHRKTSMRLIKSGSLNAVTS